MSIYLISIQFLLFIYNYLLSEINFSVFSSGISSLCSFPKVSGKFMHIIEYKNPKTIKRYSKILGMKVLKNGTKVGATIPQKYKAPQTSTSY